MRILLIAPGSPDDLDNRIVRDMTYLNAKVLFGPHAVVTVAALTPPGHEVVIHDENMHGPVDRLIEQNDFDVIGVSIIASRFTRAMSIARFCKEKKIRAVTVAGGIGVESLLARKEPVFDSVIHNEAETSWPRFLEDVAAGSPKTAYLKSDYPDLSESPAPRWDLIAKDIPSYGTLSVQTTRGCPHDCEFCDVIYTYGRKPRSKGIEQVVAEVALLQRLGATMIFMADDNFCGGDRRFAKELLRRIAALNNTFPMPIMFMTQVDILVSQDDELLALFADANFVDLMIGIESTDEAALRDMNKLQNIRVNPLDAVAKIQSFGIAVLGHMIIGNDADDVGAFSRTGEFVNRANILHHYCHPLIAPPGTRLWNRLEKEGRLVAVGDDMIDHLDAITNIVPKQMTRIELMEGLADYWEEIMKPEAYMQRALRFIAGITRTPVVRKPSPKVMGKIAGLMFGMVRFFLFKAGPGHRRAFFTVLRTAAMRGPVVVPRIVFLYTCYYMDYRRAHYDAGVVRALVRREREALASRV